MIRRFTSAQFVPANAGAKAKNPVGSTLFSTPMVALPRHPGHKILRTCCRESARKRLRPLLGGRCCVKRKCACCVGCDWVTRAPLPDFSEAPVAKEGQPYNRSHALRGAGFIVTTFDAGLGI